MVCVTQKTGCFEYVIRLYLSGQENVINDYEIVKRNRFWRRRRIDILPWPCVNFEMKFYGYVIDSGHNKSALW